MGPLFSSPRNGASSQLRSRMPSIRSRHLHMTMCVFVSLFVNSRDSSLSVSRFGAGARTLFHLPVERRASSLGLQRHGDILYSGGSGGLLHPPSSLALCSDISGPAFFRAPRTRNPGREQQRPNLRHD
ncbi:hypothetical protein M430DRAFT_227262 [Amorphotheca resinae ATCC 22711]|uniref:Uncharacterized protein n=1 Tax=Amorphotheca resinae ATCC 22711 TaxID=857342 RepID=A0A2T3B730_AMORE|nr:hypothetical protein M430DRAFT_227262 [Amorphotheca resinae ATCC 22711]PSS22560.1 hypothetical protein M430DRAFT_227262 [Amorphotheca resinae ATCC 22711]